MAKPLLDGCYIEKLENKKIECEKLLDNLVQSETPSDDGTHSEDFQIIKEKYFKSGTEFSKMLKQAINNQLEVLLGKK
jgi:hypothetical protein